MTCLFLPVSMSVIVLYIGYRHSSGEMAHDMDCFGSGMIER